MAAMPTTGESRRPPANAHDWWKGFQRLADPKISLASMASIFLGTCAAAAQGPLQVGWLAITILGIFAIEVAKNASGEVFDFDSAKTCDTKRFNRFFHSMLEQGIYLPPSQFEAAFVSAAHSEADIDRTVAAAARAFAT